MLFFSHVLACFSWKAQPFPTTARIIRSIVSLSLHSTRYRHIRTRACLRICTHAHAHIPSLTITTRCNSSLFQPKSAEELEARQAKLVRKDQRVKRKLQAAGIEYDFPGYAAGSPDSAGAARSQKRAKTDVAAPPKGVSAVGVAKKGVSEKGVASKGVTPTGISASGVSSKGLKAKGISVKGISTKGISEKGISAKGVSAKGESVSSKASAASPPSTPAVKQSAGASAGKSTPKAAKTPKTKTPKSMKKKTIA